jgi:hypothetical protein
MSQDLYNKLLDNEMTNLELPVQNMKLVSVFNDRARKVKTQAMLTLKFGEVLIGVDFCVTNKVTIGFPDKCFTMNVHNEVTCFFRELTI